MNEGYINPAEWSVGRHRRFIVVESPNAAFYFTSSDRITVTLDGMFANNGGDLRDVAGGERGWAERMAHIWLDQGGKV